jgi:hypothetical protein
MKLLLANNVKGEEAEKATGFLRIKAEFEARKESMKLDDKCLVSVNDQLLLCSVYEAERIRSYCDEDRFWEYFVKFGYIQPAAYASSISASHRTPET